MTAVAIVVAAPKQTTTERKFVLEETKAPQNEVVYCSAVLFSNNYLPALCIVQFRTLSCDTRLSTTQSLIPDSQ